MMKEYILRIDEYADLSDLSIDDENIVWVNWHYPNGLGESTPEGTIRPYPSPWHTGTPTEKGWYLLYGIDGEYHICEIREFTNFDKLFLAWQKIDPYKEKNK